MTDLMYLGDSFLFQCRATIIEKRILEDERTALILDKTIFYPQGGGQPCDVGIIESNDARFMVNDVRLDKEGIVYHIGNLERGSLESGNMVTLIIDKEKRIRNTKLHSAGHLIDCAVTQMQLPLTTTKGYHFPNGAYVEYEGTLTNTSEIMSLLQVKINNLVAQNIPVKIYDLSTAEAVARGIVAPAGKSARIVQFEGFEPCGCGGTHVHNTQEIGKIVIRKIKTKGTTVRISYEIQD